MVDISDSGKRAGTDDPASDIGNFALIMRNREKLAAASQAEAAERLTAVARLNLQDPECPERPSGRKR